MRTYTLIGLGSAALLVTAAARADDKATCLAAASNGQNARDQHGLLEARDQFRACAAAACPSVVQNDCATWLGEVERALPSVVISARDGAGADLFDVKVNADGQPFVSRLDGRSVEMNPGAHTFHFEAAGGATLDERVLVKEGEKSQPVAVVLRAPHARGEDVAASASSPWRAIGWGAGIVGLGGVAVGAAFGGKAILDENAHCGPDHRCNPGTTSAVQSAALVADVGLVGGGALLATGVILVLLAPRAGHERGGRSA